MDQGLNAAALVQMTSDWEGYAKAAKEDFKDPVAED